MEQDQPALGPAVPNEVMTYLHAYGDSRADDDGLSALRIGEAVLALRRWSAQVQAEERERLEPMEMALCERHHLVLRVGVPYVFKPIGDCTACAAMVAHARDAYGPGLGA